MASRESLVQCLREGCPESNGVRARSGPEIRDGLAGCRPWVRVAARYRGPLDATGRTAHRIVSDVRHERGSGNNYPPDSSPVRPPPATETTECPVISQTCWVAGVTTVVSVTAHVRKGLVRGFGHTPRARRRTASKDPLCQLKLAVSQKERRCHQHASRPFPSRPPAVPCFPAIAHLGCDFPPEGVARTRCVT